MHHAWWSESAADWQTRLTTCCLISSYLKFYLLLKNPSTQMRLQFTYTNTALCGYNVLGNSGESAGHSNNQRIAAWMTAEYSWSKSRGSTPLTPLLPLLHRLLMSLLLSIFSGFVAFMTMGQLKLRQKTNMAAVRTHCSCEPDQMAMGSWWG